MNYEDLNKETALNAPDAPGVVSVFDNKINEGYDQCGVSSIHQYLLKMLEENTERVRVGWELKESGKAPKLVDKPMGKTMKPTMRKL